MAMEIPRAFEKARKDLNVKLSAAMFAYLEKNGYADGEIQEAVRKYYGVAPNAGQISKYRHHPDKSNIPMIVLVSFCRYFSLSFNDLLGDEGSGLKEFPEDEQPDSPPLKISLPGGDLLVMSAEDRCFRGYWGSYYAYFMPTNSSGTGFLRGTLKLEKSMAGTAQARFELDTGQRRTDGTAVCKVYEGSLIYSKTMDCCYCILSSAEVGELCFLMFRHFHINNNRLECRVAEVLTAAAGGEDKYPTVHRMLISSQKITEEDVTEVLPLLHLTNSKIIISKQALDELGKEDKEYADVVQWILSNSKLKPGSYYEIREDTIRAAARDVRHGKKADAVRLLLDARKQAMASRYNKVSKKTDENVREFLRGKGYFTR